MGVAEDKISLVNGESTVTGPGTTKLVANNVLVIQSESQPANRILEVDHEAKTAKLVAPWLGTSGTYEYPDWMSVPLHNKGGRFKSPTKSSKKPKPGS